MTTPAKRPFPTAHPVMEDEELRDRVLDIMWARIQKTISPNGRPRRRSTSTANLHLAGGINAQEVLFAALEGVLRFDPERLEGSWEALATTIAHNKAVQAVRDNTKGRRRANQEVDLASIDRENPDGSTLADELADPLADPEAEALALAQELAYRKIAERVLSDRDREIYFRIHYLAEKRSDICDDYGLTAQAMGQIYSRSARKIHEASRQDPEFLRFSESDEGGTR